MIFAVIVVFIVINFRELYGPGGSGLRGSIDSIVPR